jgi:N6-L-threonylcarbamoyladenine synthase
VLILAIESSCDETAAAVVRDGREILSSIISSQIELHKPFGGVVPEIASREHLDKIEPIVSEALKTAEVTLDQIDAVAVTQGPGLIGSLLVGVCYAKALAFGRDLPIVGINHIEGHFYSVVFENPPIEFPALALIVSGRPHETCFTFRRKVSTRSFHGTRDDAAGEAFDKVAKMIGLGYPGGPEIEKLALEGNAKAVRFTRPKISDGRPDFSFSGLKTAVLKHLKTIGNTSSADLAASFQHAVVSQLIDTTGKVAKELRPKTLIVAGGVACNLALREAAETLANELSIPVYFPSKHLSTDNAAMIAAAAYPKLLRGETAPLSMTADITLRLQNFENEDFRRSNVRYRL